MCKYIGRGVVRMRDFRRVSFQFLPIWGFKIPLYNFLIVINHFDERVISQNSTLPGITDTIPLISSKSDVFPSIRNASKLVRPDPVPLTRSAFSRFPLPKQENSDREPEYIGILTFFTNVRTLTRTNFVT